jgi:hypothetical protein
VSGVNCVLVLIFVISLAIRQRFFKELQHLLLRDSWLELSNKCCKLIKLHESVFIFIERINLFYDFLDLSRSAFVPNCKNGLNEVVFGDQVLMRVDVHVIE